MYWSTPPCAVAIATSEAAPVKAARNLMLPHDTDGEDKQ